MANIKVFPWRRWRYDHINSTVFIETDELKPPSPKHHNHKIPPTHNLSNIQKHTETGYRYGMVFSKATGVIENLIFNVKSV